MITPNGHIAYVCARHTQFLCDLCDSAIVIEPCHGCKLGAINIRGVVHGNKCISIGGVANHQHLDIATCDSIHGLALGRENGGVGLQQIFALHARTAWAGADEQGVIAVSKRDMRIVTAGDARQ
ncbi:MAG: Uncharacterised protein [Halieaceae bacterium]|nr:MAG: Uncharacterised protein [Halieaceae bacterium]